jgi:hypothetical protein
MSASHRAAHDEREAAVQRVAHCTEAVQPRRGVGAQLGDGNVGQHLRRAHAHQVRALHGAKLCVLVQHADGRQWVQLRLAAAGGERIQLLLHAAHQRMHQAGQVVRLRRRRVVRRVLRVRAKDSESARANGCAHVHARLRAPAKRGPSTPRSLLRPRRAAQRRAARRRRACPTARARLRQARARGRGASARRAPDPAASRETSSRRCARTRAAR